MNFLSLLLISIALNFQANAKFLDTSSSAFFDSKIGKTIEDVRGYSMTWWNQVLTDGKSLESICSERWIKSPFVRASPCGISQEYLSELGSDWAKDLPLRRDRPSSHEIKAAMDLAVVQWATLMGKNSDAMRSLIEVDPFFTIKDLGAKLASGDNQDDQNAPLVSILMSFPPEMIESTKSFLSEGHFSWIGPHNSVLENKDRVLSDMEFVAVIGPILFFIFIILATRKFGNSIWKLLGTLVIGVFAGGTSTWLVFGSLHGLTLSFGIGLIGLCFDYGFHTLTSQDRKSTWVSNSLSLLTTIGVFTAIGLTDVPLFRQIALFSTVGLVTSFFVSRYALAKDKILVEKSRFPILISNPIAKTVLISIFVLGLSIFALGLKWNFSLSSFDYRSVQTQKILESNSVKEKMTPPLFLLTRPMESLSMIRDAIEWSKVSKIRFESPIKYLPLPSAAKIHLSSWQKQCREPWEYELPENYRKIFSKFIEVTKCDHLAKLSDFDQLYTHNYISGLFSNGQLLNIWLPKSQEEYNQVLKRYPLFQSPSAIATQYSNVLEGFLLRTLVLGFLAILGISVLVFKRVDLVLLSLVPIGSALSLVAWVFIVFNFDFTIVSSVALLMIIGVGIDSGIFLTRSIQTKQKVELGTWKSIELSALTTVLGFLPLTFAQHPFLFQLGITIVVGITGAFFGSVVLFPVFLRSFGKKAV